MKLSLIAALLSAAAPVFAAAPAVPVTSAPAGTYSTVFANVYVKVYGFKGSLLLNGVENCPFADQGGLPAKTATSVVCNSMKHKLLKGENVLKASFEKVPLGSLKTNPGTGQPPQETPLLKIELADEGDRAFREWNFSADASPKEIRFQFPIAEPGARASRDAPFPKGTKPVKVKPKAGTPPEPDYKLERLENFCGNEIGLLCKSKKSKVKALAACLKDHWDSLLPACRNALRAAY